jgi:hypothetical protein
MGEEGLISDNKATFDEFTEPFITRNNHLQRDMFPRSSTQLCGMFQELLHGITGVGCSPLLLIYLSPK